MSEKMPSLRQIETYLREILKSVAARRYVPLLLTVIGVVLLLYVGTQYGQMYLEQRRLAEQWAKEQAQTVDPEPHAKPVDDGLIRLSIPKINLDAIVVEGTTHHDLLLGPGHIKDTAEPGDVGNAVISAHRDTFFRHIHELSKGDVVTVQRRGHIYRYEVTAKKIVDPEDVSVLEPSSDARLTLITCYPTYYIGPAPDRLVVFLKLMPGSDQSAALSQPAAAQAAPATK